jgi:protein-disulfide isomerase
MTKDDKMTKTFLFASAAALLLSGCGGDKAPTKQVTPAKTVAAPTGTKWSETTATTPEGGMLMGNPNAEVKLIEYGALSCSHCAAFSADSAVELREMVNKGSVSYEFRNFMLGPLDVPASLLARCGGPGPFFPIAEQMYAAQPEWIGKTRDISEADQKAFATMSPTELATMLAGKLGLDTFVQQRGISADKAKTCLSDGPAIDQLTKMTQVGTDDFKVTGTPTFIINGLKVDAVAEWSALKPKLIEAGG